MSSMLDKIVATKRREIAAAKTVARPRPPLREQARKRQPAGRAISLRRWRRRGRSG